MAQQSVTEAAAVVDPSWKGLYRIGGISAILYVVLSLVVPGMQVLFTQYDFSMDAATLLSFIASNNVWWITLQTLVLGTSILAIVAFVALFVALKNVNKSYALTGAVVAGTCEVLFMAYYPVLLGLGYLSDQYPAATESQQEALATAAEALLAQNNAFNPLYESVFVVGILFLSIAMLKGVFHKGVAYVGIMIAPAAIIALGLWPVLGVNYFWWWILFMIWFVAVGWKLYRFGGG